MITAIDTSVLLDVFGADSTFGVRSKAALRACLREGPVLACEVVWAEVAGFFPTPEAAHVMRSIKPPRLPRVLRGSSIGGGAVPAPAWWPIF